MIARPELDTDTRNLLSEIFAQTQLMLDSLGVWLSFFGPREDITADHRRDILGSIETVVYFSIAGDVVIRSSNIVDDDRSCKNVSLHHLIKKLNRIDPSWDIRFGWSDKRQGIANRLAPLKLARNRLAAHADYETLRTDRAKRQLWVTNFQDHIEDLEELSGLVLEIYCWANGHGYFLTHRHGYQSANELLSACELMYTSMQMQMFGDRMSDLDFRNLSLYANGGLIIKPPGLEELVRERDVELASKIRLLEARSSQEDDLLTSS
jgi:hypothetical protein